MNKLLVCILATGFGLSSFAGALELDSLWQSGCIVSAAHETRVTGKARPGCEVAVRALAKNVTARADDAGRFTASLGKLGIVKVPFPITVAAAGETITLTNCLSGLVLLAGGQSNMEVPIKEALNPIAEARAANWPLIREFKVEHDFDFKPCERFKGRWTTVTPASAPEIGAIGFYTARRLHRELDGVPVGIVNNSYSATSIQPWLPLEFFQTKPAYKHCLAGYNRFSPLGREGVIRRRTELGKSFLVKDTENKGEAKGWHRGAQPGWKTVKIPGYLDYQAWSEDSDGAFWISRTFTLPADFPTKGVEFQATAIDDYDTTYINGTKIGATGEETPDSYDMPRAYRIPEGLLKAGENVISIRIFDTAHAGGVPEGGKIGLVAGKRELPLGGAWKAEAELVIKSKPWPADYLPLVKIYHTASVLYNAMFWPMRGTPVDAILWYQGESNAGQKLYGEMFRDLITRWRADLGCPEAPFVFMQLASFLARPKDAADTGGWPLTRQLQAEARTLANVRMVPTIDIGDANRIHPLNKQEVGRRTALWLLQDFFAPARFKNTIAFPEITEVKREGDRLILKLANAQGLRTTDNRTPQTFAVYGKWDKKTRKVPAEWVKAEIRGETIVLTLPTTLANPVGLRYAGHMNPDVNTVNALGFPLLPADITL